MSDRRWWSYVVQWSIWALVMSLVMGWLARARRPAALTARSRVLTHPPTTLIVGVVCTGFFSLLTMLAATYAKPKDWWTPYAFLGFVVPSALLIAEGLRVRHELTDHGIVYRGLLIRHDMVAWDEIASARWSASMKWLALTTRDGRVLRFSAMLNGLDSLALALNEHVTALEADEVTAEMLSNARRGDLPSIWA